MRSSTLNRAFTIVELMVVTGVLTILIGLLVPALASVAANGRSTRCQLNLKQMAVAAQNYVAMFDAFPAAIRYERINAVVHQVSWDWVMVGSTAVKPGALWNYTDHPDEVMQCPDYHGNSNFGEPFTGYNYNTGHIGGEAKPFGALGWKPVRQGVPPHACANSATCAMFGDAGRGTQSNKYMRGPLPTLTGDLGTCYSGAQAFRHMLNTNVAYVDGHVGAAGTAYQGPHATDSLLVQMGYPHNGFLSDDDSAYDPR